MDRSEVAPHDARDLIATLEAIEGSIEREMDDPIERIDWLAAMMTTHSHPIVRHEAAFVLGRLRASAPVTEAVVDALCSVALLDDSVVVRHEAAEALWNFDSSVVEVTLGGLLNDADSDVRATAELSLARRARRLGQC